MYSFVDLPVQVKSTWYLDTFFSFSALSESLLFQRESTALITAQKLTLSSPLVNILFYSLIYIIICVYIPGYGLQGIFNDRHFVGFFFQNYKLYISTRICSLFCARSVTVVCRFRLGGYPFQYRYSEFWGFKFATDHFKQTFLSHFTYFYDLYACHHACILCSSYGDLYGTF